MSVNGQHAIAANDGAVLRWSGRVLSADDVQRRVNGHRRLVLPRRSVVTQLAAEQLRERGVEWSHEEDVPAPQAAQWGIAQDRPYPLVQSAVQTLRREGVALRELTSYPEGLLCRWAKALADCVAQGDCGGGVVFTTDPGLVCCVANKLAGLRAVAVVTVAQAARATLTLAANLLVVEMPGRTFFEVRQVLRTLCATTNGCPDGVACTLRELDGHAHR